MGKTLDYVIEEATGRLVFRRVYPRDVRDFLPKPKSVLKVPLGARTYMTADAFRIYERAKRQFDDDVKAARGRARLKAKGAAAAFDRLTPAIIDDLAAVLLHDQRTGMEQRLQEGHGEFAGEGWIWLLDELRKLRVRPDDELLEGILGPTADHILALEGLRLDPANREERRRLLWALNAKLVGATEEIHRHLAGYAPPIPPRPARPLNPRGRKRTVSALVDAYRAHKWEGWKRSSRAASEAVSRVLKDAVGDREAASITREDARDIFELVKGLPVNLGKQKSLAGLSVPEAVERARELGLPTIQPRTINNAYMVHISSIWNFGVKEEWVEKNRFIGLSVADPVADRDKRDAFSTEQLTKLFSTAPWDTPAPPDVAKPGAFWVPLIALFTGARLAEIAGLRIMDAAELEGVLALRIRPYTGRSLKNEDSRRDVPVPSALLRLGFLAFVEQRRADDKPEEALFPDAKASSRGQFGAKFGERFSAHLKKLEITGTKLGMHSFRHGVEDRLRAAGVYGDAEALALLGRAIAGSQSIYGTIGGGFPIANLLAVLEKITYPGLDLAHLEVTIDGSEGN
ncbi:site-specific integrase [Sphingomonas sp. H39-1-10]|uniref:site-specific integrase n=1 Tax=Sphingomonas pollutisoli TaxID=3030829 RepID=UPI0023B95610|nr:site-specific integrase [Sphingomonas pollutisoli]MDF0490927.1 site-specific integrase [Sphingomonas pollutisoli]